ncbi:MAG: hypothetical protein F7C09_03945 [Aeropyrum sp.]|nr:hypothetical protein [Aeropyrum sp.]
MALDPLGQAELALLAFKLAVLGFYMGVVIYAAPIPLQSIKKWGPILIEDSLWAALLSLSIGSLLAASAYLQLLIGGSWPELNAWLVDAISFAALLKVLSSLVTSLPEPLSLLKPVASTVASILDELAWGITVVVAMVAGLKYLLGYSNLLLGIAVVLYAIPFRIAKPAGAWLAAFVLIFNAGLPALPAFVEAIGEPPAPKSDSMWIGSVRIFNMMGEPIPAGLLVARGAVSGETIVYEVKDGVAYSSVLGIPRVSLPMEELVFSLEYMGMEFALEPSSINTSDIGGSIELRAPNIIYSPHDGLLLASSEPPTETRSGDGVFEAIWSGLDRGDYVLISWVNECAPGISVLQGESNRGAWRWAGLEGEYIVVSPRDGGVSVSIASEYCRLKADLSGESRDLLESIASLTDYFTIDLAKMIIIYYLTLPTMYISILLVATAGVARLLGGGSKLRVKVV